MLWLRKLALGDEVCLSFLPGERCSLFLLGEGRSLVLLPLPRAHDSCLGNTCGAVSGTRALLSICGTLLAAALPFGGCFAVTDSAALNLPDIHLCACASVSSGIQEAGLLGIKKHMHLKLL